VLGMIGAGHQSVFQLRAAVEQRSFDKIIGWNYHPDMLQRLAAVAAELGIPLRGGQSCAARGRGRCHHLDHLGLCAITAGCPCPPRHAYRLYGHRHEGQAGTGSGGACPRHGFTDEIAQAVTIGEAQHAIAAGLITQDAIHEMGAVVNGTHPGRTSTDEITVFDGTGVGLQDLAVASAVVDLAVAKGVATIVEF